MEREKSDQGKLGIASERKTRTRVENDPRPIAEGGKNGRPIYI